MNLMKSDCLCQSLFGRSIRFRHFLLNDVIADILYYTCQNPRNGIGEEKHAPIVVDRKYRIDPKGTESADTDDGNEHRDERFSEPAQLSDENFHNTAEKIRGTKNKETLIAVSDCKLITGNIDREQGLSENENNRAEYDACTKGCQNAGGKHFSDSMIFSGGIILSREIHGSVKERVERGIEKAVYRACCGRTARIRCNSLFYKGQVKGVYGRLDEHRGDCEQSILDACGEADLNDSDQGILVYMELSDVKTAHSLLSSQADNDQNGGKDLRSDGCKRNAGNVHMEEIDENKVQDDIDETRK